MTKKLSFKLLWIWMDALQDRFGSIVWEAKSIKISPGIFTFSPGKSFVALHAIVNELDSYIIKIRYKV